MKLEQFIEAYDLELVLTERKITTIGKFGNTSMPYEEVRHDCKMEIRFSDWGGVYVTTPDGKRLLRELVEFEIQTVGAARQQLINLIAGNTLSSSKSFYNGVRTKEICFRSPWSSPRKAHAGFTFLPALFSQARFGGFLLGFLLGGTFTFGHQFSAQVHADFELAGMVRPPLVHYFIAGRDAHFFLGLLLE